MSKATDRIDGEAAAREFLPRIQARIRRKELELDRLRQTRDDLAVIAHGEPWCLHDSPPLRVCECGEVLS